MGSAQGGEPGEFAGVHPRPDGHVRVRGGAIGTAGRGRPSDPDGTTDELTRRALFVTRWSMGVRQGALGRT